MTATTKTKTLIRYAIHHVPLMSERAFDWLGLAGDCHMHSDYEMIAKIVVKHAKTKTTEDDNRRSENCKMTR